MTKFWAENSFLGSIMRFWHQESGKSKMAAKIPPILLTFVNSYVEVTWICIIGDFKIDS